MSSFGLEVEEMELDGPNAMDVREDTSSSSLVSNATQAVHVHRSN